MLPASAAKRLAWRPISHSFLASVSSAQRFGTEVIAGLHQLSDGISGRSIALSATRPMTMIPRRVEGHGPSQVGPLSTLPKSGASTLATSVGSSHPRFPQYGHTASNIAAPGLPQSHRLAQQAPVRNDLPVATVSTRRTEESAQRAIEMDRAPDPRSPASPAPSEIPRTGNNSFPTPSLQREALSGKATLPATPPASGKSGQAGRASEPSTGDPTWRTVGAFVRSAEARQQDFSEARRDPEQPLGRRLAALGLPEPARTASRTPRDGTEALPGGAFSGDTTNCSDEPASAIATLIERTTHPQPLPNLQFRLLSSPPEPAANDPREISLAEPNLPRRVDVLTPGDQAPEDVKRTEPKSIDSPLRRPPAMPAIDVGDVAEKVFRMLERRQRFERERRGRY